MEEFQVIDHCLMVKLPKEVDHHQAGYYCKKADTFLFQPEVNHVVFDFEEKNILEIRSSILEELKKLHPEYEFVCVIDQDISLSM